MLGIDIARYQTVVDWNRVKAAGVRFVFVKGTDGGGPAPIQRADGQVAGAVSVGIPAGLYHYAQFNPSPEDQADVLTEEIRRIGPGAMGLIPVLDLEDPFTPGAVAASFVRRFGARLTVNGFARWGLYANTSMLTGIRADDIRRDVSGTVIWAASYGPNNGRRNPLTYQGHVDVHQYTSVGAIPGIVASGVDLNEAFNNSLFLGGEDDVDLNDSLRAFIWPHNAEIEDTVGSSLANTQSYARTLATEQLPGVLAVLATIGTRLATLDTRMAALEARPAADVDEAALAAELETRGIGGVSAREMVDILNTVRYQAPGPDSPGIGEA